jgi:hypothetical protein
MGFSKLFLLGLIFATGWPVIRWLNRVGHDLPRRRPAPRQAIEAEELTACPVCDAYIARGSRRCGRPDCPRSR